MLHRRRQWAIASSVGGDFRKFPHSTAWSKSSRHVGLQRRCLLAGSLVQTKGTLLPVVYLIFIINKLRDKLPSIAVDERERAGFIANRDRSVVGDVCDNIFRSWVSCGFRSHYGCWKYRLLDVGVWLEKRYRFLVMGKSPSTHSWLRLGEAILCNDWCNRECWVLSILVYEMLVAALWKV